MPALTTHYLCGNKMLKLIDDDYVKAIILNYRNVYNLGTQGPDIFFYYGAWPWVNSKTMNKFGDRMHEEKTGEFILEALRYIVGSEAVDKSILIAYMCGYLCHYALDCHTHPYIFYKTGFVREGEAYTFKYTCYHRMFETALDVLLLKQELNKKPSEFKAAEQLKISDQAAGAIANMYSRVLKKVYAVDLSKELVCRAITDIARISYVLTDKTGIKKRLLSNLEKSLGKAPMFSSMILPLEIKDNLDYLNISRSVWQLPWDNSTQLTSSFTENFEAAANESKKLAEATLQFLKGNIDMESIMILVGNRSFTTGENCSLDLKFKYFNCIYE